MRLDYIDNVDCLDGIKEVPDNSVDLVVADQPYFLSMGHAGCKDNAFATNSEQVNSNRTFGDLSIAKPFYRELSQQIRRVLKPDGAFYYFSSGAASTDGKKVHPTQKPVEIITKMIEDSSEPGAVVLDPFMGSGTTAVAAIRTGRHFIGFEQDEKYHAIALNRVAGELQTASAEEPDDWMA